MPTRISKIFVAIFITCAFTAFLFPTPAHARRACPASKRAHRTLRLSEVAKISEQWAKQWSAKNLDAVIALYAEDAVFLPATGSRVTGRAAIRDLFAKALTGNTSDLSVRSKVTEQSGDLAYDSGEYEGISTSGEFKKTGRGNYLVVFRRYRRNQWRIVEHMWTDLPAAPQ